LRFGGRVVFERSDALFVVSVDEQLDEHPRLEEFTTLRDHGFHCRDPTRGFDAFVIRVIQPAEKLFSNRVMIDKISSVTVNVLSVGLLSVGLIFSVRTKTNQLQTWLDFQRHNVPVDAAV
jgi:predicted transcriptional regulator